jgi:hypothetical protein
MGFDFGYCAKVSCNASLSGRVQGQLAPKLLREICTESCYIVRIISRELEDFASRVNRNGNDP